MAYLGSPPASQFFAPGTDTFSGTGSQTTFTLSRNVGTVNDILVIVNNVEQQPSNYTVSNNILTFSPAPSAGTNNIYVRYLSTNLQSIVPQQGSVTPASLSTPNALYWDTSGNVGVGTTTPALKLDVVSGAIRTAGASGNSGYIQIFNNANTTGPLQIGQGLITGTDNIGYVWNTANAALSFGTNSTERMRIDSSGNVGIGTTTPLTRLDLGSIVHGTPGTGITASMWKDGAGNYFGFGVSAGQLNYIAGTVSANSHVFYSNNAERMRLDSSGNLLVGTTSGVVLGTERVSVLASGFVMGLKTTGPTNTGMWINSSSAGTSNSGSYFQFYNNSAATNTGSITSSGTNTVYSTTSDYRLKENVQPMIGALDKVSQLKPCTYKWKSDGSNGEGFIAHELQAVVPDCVVGEKDAVDEEGKPKYQGIDTSFLVATLTAAIQEQQAMIEELKTKVAALEAR